MVEVTRTPLLAYDATEILKPNGDELNSRERRNLGFGDYYSQVSNLQHYFVDEFPWMMMMTNDDAMLFALKRFQTDELDGAGDGTCHHSERIGFPFSLSRSGDKQRRNKKNFEGGVVANMQVKAEQMMPNEGVMHLLEHFLLTWHGNTDIPIMF
ncbi:hypothetical protein AHAS_Ahas01G0152100 [Arachis hypogaea]